VVKSSKRPSLSLFDYVKDKIFKWGKHSVVQLHHQKHRELQNCHPQKVSERIFLQKTYYLSIDWNFLFWEKLEMIY